MEAGPVAAATCGTGTPRAVAFSWEHEPGVSKLQQSPVEANKPSSRRTPAPDGANKLDAHHRLRVPPPPGGAAVSPSASRRGVRRPDEDPFLAAYLACTANGRKAAGRAGTGRGHKLLGWAGLRLGLGLSCKTSSSAVAEESLVIGLAKNPSSG